MLAEQTPAHYVAFDLLAYDDESLARAPLLRAPGRGSRSWPASGST